MLLERALHRYQFASYRPIAPCQQKFGTALCDGIDVPMVLIPAGHSLRLAVDQELANGQNELAVSLCNVTSNSKDLTRAVYGAGLATKYSDAQAHYRRGVL
jgi:hypothetical protein